MDGDSGILDAIDRACAGVARETARRIREANIWHDTELARLERARCALKPESTESTPATDKTAKPKPARPRRGTKTRVTRKRLSPASPAEFAERCEKVVRLVEESTEPVALGYVVDVLGLTGHKAKRAIQALKDGGRIKSIGTGSSTRYIAAKPASVPLSRQAPTQGTLEDRIVAVLEDRHRATGEELAQALRKPLGEVVEACRRLQGEERIRMSRINDRAVYVLAVRV